MAKTKSQLALEKINEKYNKKYGIQGTTSSNNSDKGKRNNSASSTRTNEVVKTKPQTTLEKINEKYNKKYGITEPYIPTKQTETPKKKLIDFNTETKNAYSSVKNKMNGTTTFTSNLTEDDRQARIKEIKSELSELSRVGSGLSRASLYGNMDDAIAKNTARRSELTKELQELERVGTYTGNDMLQWEIEDSKKNISRLQQEIQKYGQRPSGAVSEEWGKKNSELFNAKNELKELEKKKSLYDDISDFGDVVNEDDFWGQWRANYRSTELSEEAGKAFSAYMDNPTEENKETAFAYQALVDAYLKNNENALDDEGQVLSMLSDNFASYLAQQKGSASVAVPLGIAGGAIGLIGGGVGAKAGWTAGYSIGSGINSYNVIRGSLYSELLSYGMDEENAAKLANDDAIIEALIESGETAKDWAFMLFGGGIGKGVGIGSKVASKATDKAAKAAAKFASKPLTNLGLNIAKGTVLNAGTEYLEEGLQGATSRATREKALSMIDKQIGRYGEGNIDLYNRPIYKNGDGTISTVDSVTFTVDDKYLVLPTIVRDENGKAKRLNTDEEIFAYYEKTGEYLGEFDTLEEANVYANRLHSAQAYKYSDNTSVDAGDSTLKGTAKVLGDAVFGGNTEALSELHGQGVEGFKTGLITGGIHGTVRFVAQSYAAARTVEKQNEIADFVKKDENILDALIEDGKASGEGTISSKLAKEVEQAKENGNVTRDQVKQLIASNDVYRKAGEIQVVSKISAELEAQSKKNEPISVEDVKKATGFGEEGSKIVTELANRNGATFRQAEKAVKSAYMLGFTNVDGKKLNFKTETQINAFTAGKKDRTMQDLANNEKAKKATVYDGMFTENEYTKNFTKEEKTMISTVAKSLRMDISAVDKIIASVTIENGNEIEHEANASHLDGKMEISSTTKKVIHELILHEGGHRMKQLAPTEFGVLMDALYERAKRRNAGTGVYQHLMFDNVKQEHDNAGIIKDTSGYLEEFAVRELETIFNSAEEFNKWYAEISGNQQLKTNFEKFVDWILKVIEDIKLTLAKATMSVSERSRAYAELNRIKELYTNAFKASENAATARAKEIQDSENAEAQSKPVTSENKSTYKETPTKKKATSQAKIEGIKAGDVFVAKEAGLKYKIVSRDEKNTGVEISSEKGTKTMVVANEVADRNFINMSDEGVIEWIDEDMHIDNRTWEDVGSRKVKAFQFLFPEFKEYYTPLAQELLGDLDSTIKGEKILVGTYETGQEWTGVNRITSDAIARIKDATNATYDDIRNALNRLINDEGQENIALAKKIELVFDEMLTDGYNAFDGTQIPANEEYIAKKEELLGKTYESNNSEDALSWLDDMNFSLKTVNGKNIVWIEQSGLTNKQLNNHQAVAKYIAQHIGEVYTIIESGQKVYIGEDLPQEYTQSKYTTYLRGVNQTAARGKNKAIDGWGELIETATNRRWEKTKHIQNKDAKYGMYRYDNSFAFPIKDNKGNVSKVRAFDVELLIRNASDGHKYLYDIVGIKENTTAEIGILERMTRLPANRQATRDSVSKETISQNPKSVKTDFSLKDSDGNTLTEAQQEYFKDSKVRDENGNLLVVYHGSPSKFTVFNHRYLNTRGNSHGRGFYFTEKKSLAEGYEKEGGQLLKGYLNITKPLSEDKKTMTKADLLKIIKATCKEDAKMLVVDGGYDNVQEALRDTWISNCVNTYEMSMDNAYREVLNIFWNGNDNDVELISDLTNSGAGNENTLRQVYDVLGYDGVIYTAPDGTHEFVSLVSEQFKSATNAKPTSNPDINYSLKDREYIELAKDPKMNDAKLREMVDEAARVAGYNSPKLYHGTGSFGFTKFDLSKMDDKRTIFLTNSEKIASTYSGVGGERKISDVYNVDIENLSVENVAKELDKFVKEYYKDTFKSANYNYSYYNLEKLNKLINAVNEGLVKLKSEVEQKIVEYADKMSLDFDDTTAKAHRQLVSLKERLDKWDYQNLSTPIYLLIHHTDVFKDNSAKYGNLEADIRLMNMLRTNQDITNGVVVEESLGRYSIEIMNKADAIEELKRLSQKGNYALYAKMEKPLIVDGRAQNWNNIRRWYDALIPDKKALELVDDNEYYYLKDKETGKVIKEASVDILKTDKMSSAETINFLVNKYINILGIKYENVKTTREIANVAKELGYDCVVIKNITDNGGRNYNVGYEETADIYMLFDSNQVKSAETVTYDDNGNVIPLSERFNNSNDDIRYSLKDSEGKTLTESQQEYFKNSKIRDKDGNLLVMYHGTTRGGFTVFDGGKDYWYFTNDKKYAYTFEGRKQNGQFYPYTKERMEKGQATPQRYKVYLNVTNPYIADIDTVEDALYWDRSLAGLLREKGYDALMTEDMSQVIVLNANQIKNTTNKNPSASNDIRYSLKGGISHTELLDTIDDMKKGKNNATAKLAKYADDGAISTELYTELVKKYGAIPSGERPHRDVQVPQKTAKNKKVSQTVRTILEAKATPDEALPTIEKMVEDGIFSYDTYTDKQAISDAETYIKEYGWIESYKDWFDDVEKGVVSKQHTAMGWALYNNAVNTATTSTSETERKTAMETALNVLDAMVRHQRSAAQALQATRILKKLSPETQLYGVQKSVSALQNELIERYGDKAPDLKIDEDLAEQFINAKTPEERAEIEKEIYKDIGRQMPSRFVDKWNAWRYLAMLGNVRTHGRNIFGNAFFAPVVVAKNMTASAIESVVNRVSTKKMVRGKALITGNKADRALLKAAWGDYSSVADMITNGGKYNDSAIANQQIEEGRQIFKTKPLEWARKKNSALLEVEDMWFAQPHYAYALAQYCKANNITAEQIQKGKAIAPARAYAIKEAQKATYRDTNAFSQFVSEVGRNSKTPKPVRMVIEGILPFRKTPANILVRGVEYSPIGLLKGLADIRNIGKEIGKEKNKRVLTATEVIDSISAGLTGTGLLALGVYLAAQGLIRGHGEDDKDEKEFKELMGHQSYSLELPNGQSITLDWLAPEALPFFIGVNIWESSQGSDEELNFSTILKSVTHITAPMLEMSCLQGLSDLVEGIGYARSNETSVLVAIAASAATSYLMQGLPTLFGQAERTGEENRMTTYTEKDDFLTGDMQYTLGKASAKIPFWDYNQIPYIDAWGRKEASGTALKRGLNNFLNPSYTSTIDTSKMEKELLRLYEKTGEGGVFPSRADKYFTVDKKRKDLTAEEYVRYATLKGQKSYKVISDLVKSKAYKSLDDEGKIKAIKDAYAYADQKAKQAVSNYKPETWVKNADAFGSDAENYLSFRASVSDTKADNGGKISKQEVVDIILDMAQNDSEMWKMYLTQYDSTGDKYAYEKGVSGDAYMNFLDSLNDVDQPTKSGKYGTYTQAEVKKAISRTKGLSQKEKRVLYQSVNTKWKNNPY